MQRRTRTPLSLISLALAVVMSLVVAGCCGGRRDQGEPEQRHVQTPGVEVTPQNPERALGEVVTVGDFQVTVHGSTSKAATKRGFARHKARQGATLRFVEFTVKNNWDRPAILATHLWLEDNSGRHFQPTPECQFATPEAMGLLEQFNPGLSKRGKMCFEVPTDAIGMRFMFRDGFNKAVPFRLE